MRFLVVYLLENISLMLKALVLMQRSWYFYSQSIGYKSWLKDRWHTCSSQTARDRAGMWSLEVQLKCNNLCSHLDPALQFGCDLPTCVHVPFWKVTMSFAYPVCIKRGRVSGAVCVQINPEQWKSENISGGSREQCGAVSCWYFLQGCFCLVGQWGVLGLFREVRLQCRQLPSAL